MSWTFIHKEKTTSKKEMIETIMNWDDKNTSGKLLKVNGMYSVIEFTNKKLNTVTKKAVVILTTICNKDYNNFGYKLIEETEGPCYYDCPNSILKLLDEPTNEYSKEWRKKCIEKLSEKKTSTKIVHVDDIVKLRHPISADGKVFYYIKRVHPRKLLFYGMSENGGNFQRTSFYIHIKRWYISPSNIEKIISN
jgi:hypothetical protein